MGLKSKFHLHFGGVPKLETFGRGNTAHEHLYDVMKDGCQGAIKVTENYGVQQQIGMLKVHDAHDSRVDLLPKQAFLLPSFDESFEDPYYFFLAITLQFHPKFGIGFLEVKQYGGSEVFHFLETDCRHAYEFLNGIVGLLIQGRHFAPMFIQESPQNGMD